MRHSMPANDPPLEPGANALVEKDNPLTGNPAAPVYVTVGICGAALASLVVMTVVSRNDNCERPNVFNRATMPAK